MVIRGFERTIFHGLCLASGEAGPRAALMQSWVAPRVQGKLFRCSPLPAAALIGLIVRVERSSAASSVLNKQRRGRSAMAIRGFEGERS
ncbi:hypothetical protein CEXT_403881 [Caerostris extrusa]|uniref:Uncharacterized protein n=1 Tax=Caerostris extrusa TaxID=172846 RepID=A0AAV4RNH4_CAEEX|nr:hypothetical protein CEXT_403881 [Caerostris extrusa]